MNRRMMLFGVALMLSAACGDDTTGPVIQGRAVYTVDDQNNMTVSGGESPSRPARQMTVSGMAAGEALIGIDFNAMDRQLYGVTNASRIYAIDTISGQATLVGAGPFGGAVSGTYFGLDFNPAVNRLRMHGDVGTNLRLNQLTGVLAATDAALSFAAGDANAGATANIVGTAYTNNVAGATSTVLFAIDSDIDVLVRLDNPNDGVMTTVGPLGVNTSDFVGFDIAADGTAYASLTASGAARSTLYAVNTTTGAATAIGVLASGRAVVGLAVEP
ncbi:MAG: DUF4394 domain-containing protein [Gemmatimonadales bacterium]